jgi:uncharacterized protein (DUF58 family)
MRSQGWSLRNSDRTLELSTGGRWYLVLTLGLGFVSIYSGNNVIYLLESLLLSALLFSGILSELTISRVTITRSEGNLRAGVPAEDVFIVENRGRIPLYCLEFGEYRKGNTQFTAFLLFLPGNAKIRVRSRQIIHERGRHKWDGLVVATSFPFGFARKSRIIHRRGSRVVWPGSDAPGKAELRPVNSSRGELEVVTGEVEPVEPWQDASRVHWPISLRTGTLMARPMKWREPKQEVWLELCPPGDELEKRIRRAAGGMASSEVLVLITQGEYKRIEGTWRALDILAMLPKPPKPGFTEDAA